MNHQQDRDVVIDIAGRILQKYIIASWSFDKGFWNKINKEILKLQLPQVIMPKLGNRNKAELEEETAPSYKRLKTSTVP
jgi:hypothetical protein